MTPIMMGKFAPTSDPPNGCDWLRQPLPRHQEKPIRHTDIAGFKREYTASNPIVAQKICSELTYAFEEI